MGRRRDRRLRVQPDEQPAGRPDRRLPAANFRYLAGPARSAIAIGIDLGPNLSVTGSLATILWLVALRREGEHVSAWQFLKVGVVVMPLTLLLALACV